MRRAAAAAHRQHHVHRRRVRLVNRAAYCATKGGVAQPHPLPRPRVGPARDHGERGRARDHGDAARTALPDANPGRRDDDRKIPLGRLGPARDMAGAAFLASDLAGVHHRADHLRRRRVGRWRPRLVSRPARLRAALRAIPSSTPNPSARRSANRRASSPASRATSRASTSTRSSPRAPGSGADRPRRPHGRLRLHGDGADDRASCRRPAASPRATT